MVSSVGIVGFNSVSQGAVFAPFAVPVASTIGIRDKFSLQKDEFTKTPKHIARLFPNGLENIKIRQGGIGDCQFLASIDALAHNKKGIEILKKAISSEDESGLVLKFQKYPGKQISVSPDETIQHDISTRLREFFFREYDGKNDPGVKPLVIGYAKLMKEVYPKKFGDVESSKVCSIYDADGYHCSSPEVLRDITGLNVKVLGIRDDSSREEFISFSEQEPKVQKEVENLLDEYPKNSERYVLTACARYFNGETYVDEEKKIPAWHDFSIRRVDKENKIVTLANPHENTQLVSLSYKEFLDYFSLIAVLDMAQPRN